MEQNAYSVTSVVVHANIHLVWVDIGLYRSMQVNKGL